MAWKSVCSEKFEENDEITLEMLDAWKETERMLYEIGHLAV